MEKKKVLTLVDGNTDSEAVIADLKEAAHKRGMAFRRIVNLSPEDLTSEENFDKYFSDYVVWRGLEIYNSVLQESCVRWLRMNRISLNMDVEGPVSTSADKLFQYVLFRHDEVMKDHSLYMITVSSKDKVKSLIQKGLLKYPFLMKLRYGTIGNNISLVADEKQIDEMVVDFSLYGLQNFIHTDCEWRVFIVGGAPVAVLQKNAGDEVERTNFHGLSSGFSKKNEDDPKVREIVSHLAMRAAAISGLNYTGVDIVREHETGKYYLLETNFAAVWTNNVIGYTGISIPDMILDYFEDIEKCRNMEVADGIKYYLEQRLKYLSESLQNAYRSVLGFEKALDVDNSKKDLVSRVLQAYNVFVEGGEVEQEKIRDLLAEVKQTGISKFGFYFGAGVESIEDSLVPSAALIALASKINA